MAARDPRDEFPRMASRYIALVRLLNRELGLSVANAVRLADRLLGANRAELSIGNGLALRLDLAAFHTTVDRAIADGVESITPVRRGRPRKSPAVQP